jgi:dipeptidyl aminopeptidase/acylaminoacyl peptidase
MLRRTAMGRYVLAEVDAPGRLLLQGAGASPEGNKPFIDVLDLQTREKRRIWQSRPPFYEFASSILNDTDTDSALPSVSQVILPLHGLRMLARRETVEEPPQYHILTFTNAEENLIFSYRQISEFPHPYPSLRGLQKEVLRYQREDGVSLNGTLYFPPGYDQERDGQLPALLWAYPREFKSKDAAGQLRRSPHQFDPIGSTSPLLFLTQGIAVLDGPSFPIVAEGEAEPNDTYVEQLTASARAALQELERHGAIDIQKVAVGGHSYGAFMAAGLLAHAPDLFACGIARSGAYNRTMTPFGFQSEERTLWQAPETYSKMSPFNHADKIQRPLLLIHGEADNNPGTFTLQSERLYAALKGHGVVSRLVVLPYESHSYAAKESVLHVLAETQDWLQRYCVSGKALEASKNNDVQM